MNLVAQAGKRNPNKTNHASALHSSFLEKYQVVTGLRNAAMKTRFYPKLRLNGLKRHAGGEICV